MGINIQHRVECGSFELPMQRGFVYGDVRNRVWCRGLSGEGFESTTETRE